MRISLEKLSLKTACWKHCSDLYVSLPSLYRHHFGRTSHFTEINNIGLNNTLYAETREQNLKETTLEHNWERYEFRAIQFCTHACPLIHNNNAVTFTQTQTHIQMHFRLSQTEKGYLFSQSLLRDSHRPKYLFTCSPSFLIILMHVLITKMFAHSDRTTLILCQCGLFSVFVCAHFQILTTICNNILCILKGYKTKFKRKMAILVFIFSGYRLDWKCNPKHHITSHHQL